MRHHPAVIALVFTGLSLTGGAVAAPARGSAPQALSLDPAELTPQGANACTVRRVTGPRGAYRWDQITCEAASGLGSAWLDGRPLDVLTTVASDQDRYSSRDDQGRLAWPGKSPSPP